MFSLLDAIKHFFRYGMPVQVCPLMIASVQDMMAKQENANLTRWTAHEQRRAHLDTDHGLARLRAGQARLGSCEIEPAIAL